MSYTKTVWKNREVERPRTFQFQNNSDGTVTLIPSEGNIVEPGTPIVADVMNNIEDGIAAAATTEYVDQRVSKGDYGVTTNSGNAYAVTLNPAPTALVEGMRLAVKINAANTGAATLNVNGLGAKAIKKGNGNAVASGNLKANSIYTLVYDGSANFILQGEGGGGTATAGDIRSGKTATVDNGDITGVLVTRATGTTTVIPTTSDQVLGAGIYDGSITIKGYDPGKKSASGNTVLGTDTTGLSISGLGFTPSKVIISMAIQFQGYLLAVISSSSDFISSTAPSYTNALSFLSMGSGTISNTTTCSINNGGFFLGGLSAGGTKTVNWFAFE